MTVTSGHPAVPSQPPSAPQDPNAPRKRIHSAEDLEIFVGSSLCEKFVSFACELAGSVKGIPITPELRAASSPLVQGLAEILDEVYSWVEDFPPIAQPMRFGNKAFRSWHQRLAERAEGLLTGVLSRLPIPTGCNLEPAVLAAELAHYLRGAFGDERRIDYGTGHEAAFLALLFALGARGYLAKSDAANVVLVVFVKYLRVMRRLQSVYVLEPAGSHGVWGLDDFHALPFLFGAAQLEGLEDEVPTGQVYRDHVIQECADRFLYVDAIRQVLLSKRGAPFHETSPMLYDISAVPTWQKTFAGLVKMYRVEVLGKYPVIQHFLFGPTIRWPGDT